MSSQDSETHMYQEPLEECLHCGSELSDIQKAQDESFCCRGCALVYRSIHACGFGSYYSHRGDSRSLRKGVEVSESSHLYADGDTFRQRYCSLLPSGDRRIRVALQGIHCAACVWLLERLPLIVEGVRSANVHFADALIDITFEESGRLSHILNEIERLGYDVRPVEIESTQGQESKSRQRIHLIRVGIAAVCAMNTMMLAISLYQGEYSAIDNRYRSLLQWYSLALSLPVVLFAAVPFYRTAWGGLRAGVLHIDLPIVAALLAAFGISVYHTVFSNGGVYYDSVTTVIFLLLFARYLQSRIIEKVAGKGAMLAAVLPLRARRVDADGASREVYSGEVGVEDTLRISSNEMLSADGIIVAGKGKVNLAFISGESLPVSVGIGDLVFAGSTVVTGECDVKITAVGESTRVGKLIRDVAHSVSTRPEIESFLDRRSRSFTALVVVASMGTAIYWFPVNPQFAVERTIALLLVTCPCVLALATPITFSVALIRAARSGILLKSAEVIERLVRVKHLIFDKTGTLTTGLMSVRKMQGFLANSESQSIPDPLIRLLCAAEDGIDHPIAFALKAFAISHSPTLDIGAVSVQRRVIEGSGIEASNEEFSEILIGSPRWDKIGRRMDSRIREVVTRETLTGATVVVFSPSAEQIFIFSLSDSIRHEVPKVIAAIRKKGIGCSILSGDLRETTEHVARQISVDVSQCFAPCTPTEKAEKVKQLSERYLCAMVGDGINDIGAFAQAEVGIGMVGGAEASLKVADVYLADGSIEKLPQLLDGASKVMQSIRLGLCISAFYNVVGAVAAFTGYLGPLEAAILMPISSFTSITIAASRKTFNS